MQPQAGGVLLQTCCSSGSAVGILEIRSVGIPRNGHWANLIYLGIAQRQRTDPVSAHVLRVANLEERAELLKSLRQR